MKERFSTRVLRVISAASLVFTAACTGVGKVFTPTQEFPAVETSPTPTFEPTQTFTPEPTFTPSIEPTPTLPENPGFFEGVGQIAGVEEHEGKWYGIDTIGRAEIVQNETGDWVRYNRPIETVIDTSAENAGAIPALLLKDIDQSRITRLKNGADQLGWGVVDEDQFHAYISGYSLGSFDITANGITARLLAFEVPLKYGDQVFTFWLPGLPGQSDGSFMSTYSIPSSGDIQKKVLRPIDFHGLMLMMSNSNIVGHQVVLALGINRGKLSGANAFDGQDDGTLGMIVDSLKAGNAVSAQLNIALVPQGAWVEGSLFPSK